MSIEATPATQPKPFWRRRRVIWPVVVLLLLAAIVTYAVRHAHRSWVAVENDTGANLSQLTITACGQQRVFHALADRSSVRFVLAGHGDASEVALSTADNTGPSWHGEYIEPTGGYRVLIHLRRGGQVESQVLWSLW